MYPACIAHTSAVEKQKKDMRFQRLHARGPLRPSKLYTIRCLVNYASQGNRREDCGITGDPDATPLKIKAYLVDCCWQRHQTATAPWSNGSRHLELYIQHFRENGIGRTTAPPTKSCGRCVPSGAIKLLYRTYADMSSQNCCKSINLVHGFPQALLRTEANMIPLIAWLDHHPLDPSTGRKTSQQVSATGNQPHRDQLAPNKNIGQRG